jgi:L-2-amino-thiazoline-4-carboxylic acid hydrolase
MDLTEAMLDKMKETFVAYGKISLLERVKIQAQVLLPVLRALRKELGAERANKIVGDALREWSRKLTFDIAAKLPGTGREKWEASNAAAMPMIGNDVDFQMVKRTPEAFEFKVTGCRYADFFRQLGEPELGAILLCETDVHGADATNGEVTLERPQTIMKGGDYCDFRYRMKKAAGTP